MTTLSLRLPNSIHQKLVELAEAEGVSVNRILCSAAAEKLAALMTEDYLHQRARQSSDEKFLAVLAKVPAGPPMPGDEIPDDLADMAAPRDTPKAPRVRRAGKGTAGR